MRTEVLEAAKGEEVVGKMRTEVLEAAKGEEVVDMEELIDYSVQQFVVREAEGGPGVDGSRDPLPGFAAPIYL
ncbi:hypothetical protein T484DRAFT_1896654 [Baffinella frigidus]|nr:hypothetical protein T484DRAFT_1896654 [Cryptophyta sp. CCMP2293]